MSKRKITRGTTSVTVPVFVQSTIDGSGLSGLTSATAGLVCKFRRHGNTAWTTVTLSAGTLGTWSSGGFIADSNGPSGTYELGIPDTALATNSWVMVALYGAANMAPVMMEFELDAINYQDGVRLGLTALPNLAAGANGGLPLSMDANGRVDVGEWLGVAPNALISGRVDSSTGSMAASVITSTAINNGAFAGNKFADGFISNPKIADGAINSNNFVAGAIDAGAIATGAITANKFATGAISSSTFGAGAINAAAIATNAITAAKIATDAIGSAQLATDAITSAQVAASAVTKIQSGLSTYAGADTSGTTTLLSRLTSTRATGLDNLDATVSSRNATAPPTAAAIRTEIDTNSTKLANLDATVSSRSTYAGSDTAGTTTLLSRLTSTRAGNMDNLDAAVSGIPLATWNILRSVTFGVGSIGEKFKAWMADLGSDNRVKVTADAHTSGATVAAVSGDTKQTGDAFARIGTNGAGLTALGDTRLANLDAAVSSRNATTPPTVAAIRAELDSNSTKLANLDATISSRSTYNGADTTGTTTLLTRLTSIRAGLLDNLDAAISSVSGGDGASAEAVALAVREELAIELAHLDASISTRSTYAGTDTTGTTTLLSRLTAGRATNLDNLDATVSSRSTYDGDDTAGTTTLLSRLSSSRASLLDNLDTAISTRLALAGYTAPDNSTISTLASRLSAARALLLDNLDNLDAPISTIESGTSGEESAGVTILLSRLTETRAVNLDNLDMPISDLPTADEVGDELIGVTVGSVVI